jgi:hypothetical protein
MQWDAREPLCTRGDRPMAMLRRCFFGTTSHEARRRIVGLKIPLPLLLKSRLRRRLKFMLNVIPSCRVVPKVTRRYRSVSVLGRFNRPLNRKSSSKFLRSLMLSIVIYETSCPLRTGHQIASPANTPGRVAIPQQVRLLADHVPTSVYRKRGSEVMRHRPSQVFSARYSL